MRRATYAMSTATGPHYSLIHRWQRRTPWAAGLPAYGAYVLSRPHSFRLRRTHARTGGEESAELGHHILVLVRVHLEADKQKNKNQSNRQ